MNQARPLLTVELLVRAVGCTRKNAERYVEFLNLACSEYGIVKPSHLAAFLAQIGHESGSFQWARELWGPTPAQQRYEGRRDLGNTQPGDGRRFAGAGLIHTTGRANYATLRERLRQRLGGCPDFEAEPEALQQPKWAAYSATDFWDRHNLNALAEAGEFERITRRINGGLNGHADRVKRWEKAKAAFAELQQPEEKDVNPFVMAALPEVLKAAPALIDLFKGESKSSERNAEVAKVAVGIAKEAIGAANEQELVQRLETEPQAREVVKEAIETRWFEVQQAHDRALSAARDYALKYAQQKDVRIVLLNMTFLELLTIAFMFSGVIGGLLVLFLGEVSAELKGMIVGLILVESVVGVRKFWFGNVGSTMDSESKKGGKAEPA